MLLTDAQWEKISAQLPVKARREDGRGRPAKDRRKILEGILWILRTGAQWREMPGIYGSYQTAHRVFQQWSRDGVFETIVKALVEDLEERGDIDVSECFIDGTFSMAKKGGLKLAKPSVARAQRSWQLQTLMVLSSPQLLQVLRRMKSPLFKKLSHLDLARHGLAVSLETKPMTQTSLMKNSKNKALT